MPELVGFRFRANWAVLCHHIIHNRSQLLLVKVTQENPSLGKLANLTFATANDSNVCENLKANESEVEKGRKCPWFQISVNLKCTSLVISTREKAGGRCMVPGRLPTRSFLRGSASRKYHMSENDDRIWPKRFEWLFLPYRCLKISLRDSMLQEDCENLALNMASEKAPRPFEATLS